MERNHYRKFCEEKIHANEINTNKNLEISSVANKVETFPGLTKTEQSNDQKKKRLCFKWIIR